MAVEIRIKWPSLHSQRDEVALLNWLQSISGVCSRSEGRYLVISARRKRLSDAALRDLLGLFYRYRLPMRQLAVFLTARNRTWFASPDKYWHKRVFSVTDVSPVRTRSRLEKRDRP